MDNDFDDFIKNIMEIEKHLSLLEKKSENLVDGLTNKMRNINFSDKDLLITKYEDYLTAITHEVGSEIGFYRDDIDKLNKYIHFRIKYHNFTDENIEKIIDEEITILEKKEIFQGNNNKDMINMIKEMKQEWNKVFKNLPYKKLKKKIRLDKI